MALTFRYIKQNDNQRLAELIRSVFREYGIEGTGTVYSDPTTDNLFELFNDPASEYWIAEENGQLIGGCGIFPTPGLPPGIAELVKFYVSSSFRGKGIGKQLMHKCFESASRLGYTQLYLESLPELAQAISMYQREGFTRLSEPLGNSGHFSCSIWMLKELKK
jgi:putative acetyltransferase